MNSRNLTEDWIFLKQATISDGFNYSSSNYLSPTSVIAPDSSSTLSFSLPNRQSHISLTSPSSLVFMIIFIGFLIPIMLAYKIYNYIVFRGKVVSVEPE